MLFSRCALAAVLAACSAARLTSVPQYVLDYAPLVYLYSADAYRPTDIGSQLVNTHPALNHTKITDYAKPLTLDNLDELNSVPKSDGGSFVYLSSNKDFRKLPSYLHGTTPDANGTTEGARTCAVILNDKGNGTLDAFFMYFYAYNQGNKVLGEVELGDHVGDWEHNMVRFVDGAPSQLWYSEHNNGEAFTYAAVHKSAAGRPLAYSGNGTHALWATVGEHDHTIPDAPNPVGPLEEATDAGPLWDPVASAYFYSVAFPANAAANDSSNPTFAALPNPFNASLVQPVNYLYFNGQWGNPQLPPGAKGQEDYFGFYKYTGGPTGPRDKQLNRVLVCPQSEFGCIVRTSTPPGS